MNAEPKPLTLEDATDKQLLDECEDRGCLPPEKDTGDFGDDQIRDEYQHRFGSDNTITATEVYEELYRTKADVPQIVKDYIYGETGRTLP